MSQAEFKRLRSGRTFSTPPLKQEGEVEQIIFPLSLSQGAYNLSEYTPKMTNDKLSKDDVEQFFQKISGVTEKFNNVKPGNVAKKILTFVLIFVILFIGCLGGIIAILLKEGPDMSNAPQALRILLICLIGLSIILTIAFFIVVVRYNIMINSNNRNILFQIQEIIDKENNHLQAAGLRWALPTGHYNWVELWNENKLRRGNRQSTQLACKDF